MGESGHNKEASDDDLSVREPETDNPFATRTDVGTNRNSPQSGDPFQEGRVPRIPSQNNLSMPQNGPHESNLNADLRGAFEQEEEKVGSSQSINERVKTRAIPQSYQQFASQEMEDETQSFKSDASFYKNHNMQEPREEESKAMAVDSREPNLNLSINDRALSQAAHSAQVQMQDNDSIARNGSSRAGPDRTAVSIRPQRTEHSLVRSRTMIDNSEKVMQASSGETECQPIFKKRKNRDRSGSEESKGDN